ncbi:hypothetical protein Dimus_000134 [Dionaea muscipula]
MLEVPTEVRAEGEMTGEAPEEVPAEERCSRREAPDWRCPERVMQGESFCERHHLMGLLHMQINRFQRSIDTARRKRKRQREGEETNQVVDRVRKLGTPQASQNRSINGVGEGGGIESLGLATADEENKGRDSILSELENSFGEFSGGEKRGRPKGSKKRPKIYKKEVGFEEWFQDSSVIVGAEKVACGKRGRPKGSKSKITNHGFVGGVEGLGLANVDEGNKIEDSGFFDEAENWSGDVSGGVNGEAWSTASKANGGQPEGSKNGKKIFKKEGDFEAWSKNSSVMVGVKEVSRGKRGRPKGSKNKKTKYDREAIFVEQVDGREETGSQGDNLPKEKKLGSESKGRVDTDDILTGDRNPIEDYMFHQELDSKNEGDIRPSKRVHFSSEVLIFETKDEPGLFQVPKDTFTHAAKFSTARGKNGDIGDSINKGKHRQPNCSEGNLSRPRVMRRRDGYKPKRSPVAGDVNLSEEEKAALELADITNQRSRQKSMCHQCLRSDKGVVISCSNCNRRRYCLGCLKNW